MKSASTAQETLNQIYANRSLSSVYSIPRKQTGAGSCLEEVKKDGREWREIIKIVQQSVVDKNTMARWQIDKIQLCVNTTLEEQFIKKRQKMKEDGRSSKELIEQHAFHVVSRAKAKHVCQSGLEVCQGPSVFANILGRSDMGVHLRRNADITLKLAEKCSYTQTALVVFKIIPGRMKSIPTSFKLIEEAMEPTPNFDCHVSNRKPTAWQKEAHQLANSCIYLYEYDDSCHPSKAPRQILPYAVLTCTLVSPPKVPVTSVISVTDVSTTDTDGSCSDMDIVDDSDDAKDDEVKKAESSSTSVSTEAVRGKQASERSTKLSVEDIQGCNLGPSSQSDAGVFVKPRPLPCGNKKSQKTNHSTHPTTSQGTRRTTLLQPATFQYGSKESKTSDQSTVQSESNSGGTSSQRLKNMAAGFFAKLKDPRIQQALQSKKSYATSGVKGGTRKEPERKPDIPENAQEGRLKSKPKMRQAEHSSWQEMKKTSSDVLKRERARKQEAMPMGYSSKQVSTKCSTSSKSLTVGRSASKHTGGITKRKLSTRFKEKMKKQLADVLLADEIKIPPRKGQMSAGIQKEKKRGENVKETKTHSQQSGSQDGKSSAFERQVPVKNIRHTDDKQNATESNPAEQPVEGLKKASDTPVKELLSGKASGLDPSDSEHTEMLSALQSLDQTLDILTPSTVVVSSSEMSDSTSEETLCRAQKVNKTVSVKMEENISPCAGQEESKCLEVMDMPEQNVIQAAQIDYERNKVSAGNMSPKERSVKLEVDFEEMQGTDTNNEEESMARLQASGSKNHPEDSSSKRTIKQEATDTTGPSCQHLCVKADFTEGNLMESHTCDEEATGGNNSTMFVIDQVFSLAGNGTSQTLAQEQEEKIIPEDTAICLPYDVEEQATSNSNGLPASQIVAPQGYNRAGLPVSDAMDSGSKAGNLEINTTRPFVTTTSVGVARPQTSRPSVSEDTSSATLGRRDATAGVRGGQGCQTSYQSRSCMWLRKDAMLESLLMGSLNTLELGIQNLQARSDCPQLVIAVRTAATIATRTSATLLELAVQEVRDHMSRKPDQMLGGMLQEPTLDCRKLESLISGTINTLKMTSDNMDDSCSLQSSFRTALTLLELALDIVWIRSQPRGSTIGQPELYNIPPSQGESMASEAHRPMECQSNVFSSQWEESGRHWHTNNERGQQVTVFPMEKQEGHGSSQRKLATGGTSDVTGRAKPITPPPLPPPLPTFMSFPPQQLFTIAEGPVSSPSLPSGEAAELGADHCSNLIGTSGKCGDLEPECAVIGTKEMSASMQTKTLHKVEGSCNDKEVTPNLSINVQNMTVDHNENNHVEVNLESFTRKTYLWHLAEEKRRDRNEELTPMLCDEPMPLEKARTEQEGQLKGEEEKTSLKMKAAFPSEDTRAMSGFALCQETADKHRMLCDHEESRNQAETQPCTENSSSPEQMSRRMEESNAKLTQKTLPTKISRRMKRMSRRKGLINKSQKGGGQDNDGSTYVTYDPSLHPFQVGVVSQLADDNMEQLADDVPTLTDHHEFDSSLSSSVGGQSFHSSSSHDSFLCNKETVAKNTASKGASRPFSCAASVSKGELTDVESPCTFSGKLAANVSPTLGNKLAMAAVLSTKLSCPKMFINEHSTASPVKETTTKECDRQTEKEAYERARKQWTRLCKSLVHQEVPNKAGREVKAEEQQKSPNIDSGSATVHDCELEAKTELTEQNTSEPTAAASSHEAGNSVLYGEKEGSTPSNKNSGSPGNLCESELCKTFSMTSPQDNGQGAEGRMLHDPEEPAPDRICTPLYNAVKMSQDSKPFDFDMVLSCARSGHAQQVFQCVTDRMKKVSAEIEQFQQGIVHLELNKNILDGVNLQKDQHKLLLRAATIHLSEISTELEMLQATKTYLSNIQRREKQKTPLRDVSLVPEEEFAPPEERKPDTIRNILLRQLDMKKGQVKALHKSLRSYQQINGNNMEFVRMLLRSQIHAHGEDIHQLEDVLKEEKPSVRIIPDKAKISEVQERQAKCQDLLKTLLKDSSPDHAKIEWCKMKCGKYHTILLYEGDKCYLWENRNRSKSKSPAEDDKTKPLDSREISTAEAWNSLSSKTMKRQHDAGGKQASKKRKTVQKRLDHEAKSQSHINPTADETTVEASVSLQEKPGEKGQSGFTDRPERPEVVSAEKVQKPSATGVPSPRDSRQQQPSVTAKSSKSLQVTIINPDAKGQAEVAVGHSSKASQDIPGESTGTIQSVVTKTEAASVASAVSHSISTVRDSSLQERRTFSVTSNLTKCPLDSEGGRKVKTTDTKHIRTHLANRTVPSPSRQAAGPGVHCTSRTLGKQSFLPRCPNNMYSAVPYTYPVHRTPPRQVQYPTSHLQHRGNWSLLGTGPNVLHRPMIAPHTMFPFPNQPMFPNRWQTN
ncbi:uncharacterized protein LOC144903983 [Branchiostoma floridae x Branchiostoma belcheri]